MTEGPKQHVFISYVRENSEQVEKLAEMLRAYGVKVWLDKNDIKPGQRWQKAIRDAIKEGMFFIACFSAECQAKPDSYMRKEILLAIEELAAKSEEREWFIPAKINACKVPDTKIGPHETLRDLQWVELYPDWKKDVRRVLDVIDPDKARLYELISTLESADDELDRANAARQLGTMAQIEETAIPALARALADASAAVRDAACAALARIGEPAVPLLVAMLGEKDRRVRGAAYHAVALMGPRAAEAVPALAAALHGGDAHARRNAVHALARIGEAASGAVPALVAALNDVLPDIRLSAANGLTAVGKPAVPALIAALKDADAYARRCAAHTLGRIGEPAKDAVPALIAALMDADVRTAAAYALGKIGVLAKDAVPALIGALKDADGNLRAGAAFALRRIGTPEALQALNEHNFDLQKET